MRLLRCKRVRIVGEQLLHDAGEQQRASDSGLHELSAI
jgi:hypothetical protein